MSLLTGHTAFLLDQGMTAAEIRVGVISLADTLAAEV
jgi:hypothetical protein